MKASLFEFRFRFPLQVLILALGFFAPWLYFGDALNLETRSLWLVLASGLFRAGLFSFTGAAMALLGVALLLAGLGAFMRVWGAAYDGDRVQVSAGALGDHLLGDGPFRYTRNPLYLGTILHTLGIALLMPPSGAVLAVLAMGLLNVRLALREETRLREHLGAAYAAYCAQVPRFLPRPSSRVQRLGQRPTWLRALLAELYFVGAFVVLTAFGWSFNASPLRRGMIICLGVSLVVRAFLPATPRANDSAAEPAA